MRGGAKPRECAEVVGVCRTTVTGWVNHHVPFITEVCQRRQQRSRHLSDLVGEALVQAVTVVRARLDDGDLAAAVALLRLVDESVLCYQSLLRPVTVLTTTNQLSDDLESELMLDSLTPGRSVLTVEEHYAAHATTDDASPG
jgi:hypothetical protein